ncbi:MAG: V-type ATP synthase subunit E [Clostridiaceae bacterium]
MTDINNIKDRILRETKDSCENVIKDANLEKEMIIKKSLENAEKEKIKILAKAKNDSEEKAHRIISKANMKCKNDVLNTKQDIIKDVFKKVISTMDEYSDEENRDLIANLIKTSTITGDEEVVLSPKDKSIIGENFIIKLNEEMKKLNKKGELKISSETKNILGGVILKSSSVEINSSLEAILNSLKDDITQDVANILFA